MLDMGEPVKIVDLARNLIRLSGKTEDEIKIEFSGIRPGEKLYEELMNKEEVHHEQVYEKIYRGKVTTINSKELDKIICNLQNNFNKQFLIDFANNKIDFINNDKDGNENVK